MASSELRIRGNWQTYSGAQALKAEEIFHLSLQNALDSVYPENFLIERYPKDFEDIYSRYPLPRTVLDEIYNIDIGHLKYKWGIRMDCAIRNLANGKTLFVEIKRQDGWTESTNMQAGRGNAHERSCKYFTPGLLKVLREKSGLSEEILPFWIVFIGDITRDPRRNREIAFWFQEYTKNYFMWRDTGDIGKLLDFFENNLLAYLL